jgi:hypothetical protein
METATEEVEVVVPVAAAAAAEGTAPNPEAPVAPEVIVGVHVDVLPEASTEMVVRSPEIEDAAPIHSVPMAEATMTSRDGLELLADDLVDPATVARNLESMRHVEQWIKVCCSTLSSRVP